MTALLDSSERLLSGVQIGIPDVPSRELALTRLCRACQLFEALVVLRGDRLDHLQQIDDVLLRLGDQRGIKPFPGEMGQSTMLLSGCHQFDRALADVDAVGEDMLGTLLGMTSSAFDKRAAIAMANPLPTGTNYLDIALHALVEGDVRAASEAAAHYGTEIGVANEVALVLSKHFGRPVSGSVIHARLP